mmetsp:Transcript_21559/g.51455  ORF Transcript_21559/g.51455 Transcript_21559/m.51455 type:complete len:295 (-) Transcript_21559:170-1054(-)
MPSVLAWCGITRCVVCDREALGGTAAFDIAPDMLALLRSILVLGTAMPVWSLGGRVVSDSTAPSRARFLLRRSSRRRSAAACAARCPGVEGMILGKGLAEALPGRLRLCRETKVRNAWQHSAHSPVRGSSSWTRTCTSIEDENVRLTTASMMTIVFALRGRTKCTASTLAVTHGPRAAILDDSPAQRSIQLITVPARQTPSWSQSIGRQSCCITTRVASIAISGRIIAALAVSGAGSLGAFEFSSATLLGLSLFRASGCFSRLSGVLRGSACIFVSSVMDLRRSAHFSSSNTRC